MKLWMQNDYMVYCWLFFYLDIFKDFSADMRFLLIGSIFPIILIFNKYFWSK